MCRLAAYIGPEIPLERIVVLPAHSLLDQSQNALEAKLSVNGDGFGLAWYDDEKKAGLYRDILPAWSDGNLINLCRMVKSRLFLAHIRASTIGGTSRVNCHPFRNGCWTFVHNGLIGNFSSIERALEEALPDDLYHARYGTTDSELFFLTLLANGLAKDPLAAISAAIAQIKKMQARFHTHQQNSDCPHRSALEPNRIACAFSDGESIYAFRYSDDGKSPTLYLGNDLDSSGRVIVSEMLDDTPNRWTPIHEGELIKLDYNSYSTQPLIVDE